MSLPEPERPQYTQEGDLDMNLYHQMLKTRQELDALVLEGDRWDLIILWVGIFFSVAAVLLMVFGE